MINPVKQYFSNTHTLLYSFLFSLPLFLIYESLILISQPNADQIVRISVDVWMKSIFTYFGVNAVSFSLLVMMLLGFFILYKERERLKELRFSYFPLMMVECLIYAIVVAFISNMLVSLILNMSASDSIQSLSYLQKLALSLGAGLYEELFFRVILVSVLILLFNKIFGKKWAAVIAAVTLSALLFSAVHYTGSMGDLFTLNSFAYRFIFGLILNGLYVWRGFGVAAWTHALYDVLVISFLGG
ncbi:MAG: CPBP family intramembrane glutamic endopeptidase [Balneola sp.]